MSELIVRSGGRGGGIRFDIDRLEEERAALRRLELEEYVVQIPPRSGSGAMADKLEEMAELMLELYEATQDLISASEKMLAQMGGTMEETDESLASAY